MGALLLDVLFSDHQEIILMREGVKYSVKPDIRHESLAVSLVNDCALRTLLWLSSQLVLTDVEQCCVLVYVLEVSTLEADVALIHE